jgi:hypothetical protein
MPKPGTDADGIAELEADHHLKCPGCGEWFDMRDLDQVAKHIHDGDFEKLRPGGALMHARIGMLKMLNRH